MIVLFIIATVGFLIYEYFDFGMIDIDDVFFSTLLGLVGGVVGLVIMLFVSISFNDRPLEDCRITYSDEKIELVALKDNFQVEGTAFLFSSTVNDELKYTYIYETDMGMTTKSLKANGCYIKYIDDNETPYIQKWTVSHPSKFMNKMFFLPYDRYTIYLPEGSVIEEVYNIDIE
jgi:hypothetical protein